MEFDHVHAAYFIVLLFVASVNEDKCTKSACPTPLYCVRSKVRRGKTGLLHAQYLIRGYRPSDCMPVALHNQLEDVSESQ